MTGFLYKCSDCDREYSRDAVRYLCPACAPKNGPGAPLAGVLEARFDFAAIRKRLDRNDPDWSLLCAVEAEFHPPFAVGGTPLVPVARLGGALGFGDLLVKNDGLNPSGSLKDRASYLVAAEAARLGEKTIAAASTGNAATALAAVCAASGRKAVLFVPEDAPRAKLVAMLLHGAAVVRIKGTYDDAFRLSLEYTDQRGGLNRNTAYHPLTIEGKKTAAFEIFAQCGGRAPAAVVVPVGDGVIIAGVFKGFRDLMEAGLIDRVPRLIAVQAEKSDAIHRLITTGQFSSAPSPDTVADSISVATPCNAPLAARAVKESDGFSLTVTDEEILDGQRLLAKTTGIFAEPAAAAAVAGLGKAAVDRIDRDATTVLLITGHGLKDIDAPLKGLRLPDPVEPDLSQIDC